MLKYSQMTDRQIFYQGDAMEREEVRKFVNVYCHLRDVQYAAYTNYARRFNLTTNELFVLDIIYFAPQGCTQAEICTRMSATKQTISAIIKKFLQLGYVTLVETESDRRQKIIHLTAKGIKYARQVIQPAADAEIDAMAALDSAEIAELVRLTEKFSALMADKFSKA